jgi:hypothetical protein
MAVDVNAGRDFHYGLARPLFRLRVSGNLNLGFRYSVSSDGKRFLVNSEADVSQPRSITAVLNWANGATQ